MRPALAPFVLAARFGRGILVFGLAAGIALPELALAMKPWIAECIVMLLFLSALRVGPRQAIGALHDLGHSAGLALVLQLALPLFALLAFRLLGVPDIVATPLVLMASAPPISGSPNLAILTGADPAPALRQLVIGTALLPLTVLPVFWLSPDLGGSGQILAAAGRLLLIIGLAAAAAFAARRFLLREPSAETIRAIDGLSAIVMAIVVIGLMSAIGPAMIAHRTALLSNLFCAFAANFGLQVGAFFLLRKRSMSAAAVPLAIVAGNRNIALFLTALPTSVTDPLLLFIGCYQIPMYLTPVVLGRLYRRADRNRS
jgi:predicted Na+-dependent transporter